MSRKSTSRQQATKRVKEAVEHFIAKGTHPGLHDNVLDELACKALGRLCHVARNSDRITAAEAIVLAIPETKWGWVFADCVIAEKRARNHKSWIGLARAIKETTPDIKKAFREVARYLDPSYVDSRNSAAGFVSVDQATTEALDIIRQSINAKHRLAMDHLNLVSRKTIRSAARMEGTAWILDSLTAISQRGGGSAEPQYVAAIATAVLDMGEVTIDAARKAKSFKSRLSNISELPARSIRIKPSERAAL